MTCSDIIELIGIFVSLAVGVISTIISVETLKQNSQMIEEQTRPYITVYGQKTYFGTVKYVLTIKNFGMSGGTITKFNCNTDLKKYIIVQQYSPFKNIVGTVLAPNQSISCEFDIEKLKKCQLETIDFEIEYKGLKNYSEKVAINFRSEIENIVTRKHSTDSDPLKQLASQSKIISDTLWGIGEKMI